MHARSNVHLYGSGHPTSAGVIHEARRLTSDFWAIFNLKTHLKVTSKPPYFEPRQPHNESTLHNIVICEGIYISLLRRKSNGLMAQFTRRRQPALDNLHKTTPHPEIKLSKRQDEKSALSKKHSKLPRDLGLTEERFDLTFNLLTV